MSLFMFPSYVPAPTRCDELLGSTAIRVALLSWFKHYNAHGKDHGPPTLKRRPDGSLTFMDGTPVKAYELKPGTTYDIIEVGE